MEIELTGPHNCAECGTEITLAMVEEGEAGPVFLSVNEQVTVIPGLVQCTNCAGEVMVGERESNVTAEKAKAFLTEVFAPKLAENMTKIYNRFQDVTAVVHAIDPDIEMGMAMIDLEAFGADQN